MMTPAMQDDDNSGGSLVSNVVEKASRKISSYLDKTTLYSKSRWFLFFFFIVLFLVRIYYVQGFFVVTYAVGIYLLNLFIGFLSPQIDPETDAYVLPVREAEEYRPFQRRLPEFKFWLHGTKSVIIGLIATFFPAFDLPVFWPVLFIYFMMLFFVTMKQQIKNMIQHKYIPFSWGKQTYGDITRKSAPRQNAFGKRSRVSFPSMQAKTLAHTS